jgi:hypothetical protein
METPLLSPPGPGFEIAVRGNLLGPTIRRDLCDLNRQFVDLALEPELAEDPRFGLPEAVRRSLAGCPADGRDRLCRCPFALFELRLPDASPRPPAGNVADERGRHGPDAATAVRCHAFSLLSLSVARQFAEGAPLSPRLALGLSAAAEAWLANLTPSELAQLAATPGLLRPRWPRHPRYWGMLIESARVAQPESLEWAHCVGLCLLAGEPVAPVPGLPHPRRRLRAARGWPSSGVPC